MHGDNLTLRTELAGVLPERKTSQTTTRFLKYILKRILTLFAVVLVSVYLTILVTSKSVVIEGELGGPGENPSPISGWFSGIANPSIRFRTESDPASGSFFRDSLRLLVYGVTFNLGYNRVAYYFSGIPLATVSETILDSLPRTLLIFGTANLLIFLSSILLALLLTRKYGSWVDRLVLGVSPFSSVPPWIYGLILNIFTLKVLRIYIGGSLSSWPDEFSWSYMATLFKHLAPAILAIFLSKFFQSVLAWRSFLLIFSSEDYVELAKAKGLPTPLIERRYLLRPVLPSLITSFTMLMITIWQEAIVVELFFSVTGIGHLFYNAIRYKDMPLMIGITVTFAYLMAISVFLLEIIYAFIDPRARIGDENRGGRVVEKKNRKILALFGNRRPVFLPGPAAHESLRRQVTPAAGGKTLSRRLQNLAHGARRAFASLQEINKFPSAVAGLVIIALLLGVSAYALLAIPYQEAVRYWNHAGRLWVKNPVRAAPEWFNLFRTQDLPKSIFLDSRAGKGVKSVQAISDELTEILITFPFDYPYQGFPQDLILYLHPTYREKLPHITLTWLTPDGREIDVGSFSVQSSEKYDFAFDNRLQRRLDGQAPQIGLFADPAASRQAALPGHYELRLSAIMFEEENDIEAEFQLFGQVYGLAGTDHRRRDLTMGLLWGAPVALTFGILGAFGTSLLTMLIAAAGAWNGGWLDGLIQRITEVNLVLPAFPILLIVYNFYWKSFWALLGMAVLLGIFGSAIKTYRAAFLQVKEAPYVEAARTYGTSNLRIIFQYLVPRIIPILIPQLIILVPSYVYLEATLAYLNMSDPLLPTWGKIIQEALANGGLDGAFYWLAMPASILLLTGFAFMMVGYAFERVLNPRLRESG